VRKTDAHREDCNVYIIVKAKENNIGFSLYPTEILASTHMIPGLSIFSWDSPVFTISILTMVGFTKICRNKFYWLAKQTLVKSYDA
jgi:hypothetical protein